MTGVEKMRRYIERTGAKFPTSYSMSMSELDALREMELFEALLLAFEYGQAKGFRYSQMERGA